MFLSVFQWQHRKGPDALLKAYWNAFDAKDDVVLRIRAKVPGWAHNPFQNRGVKHWAKALWNTAPGEARGGGGHRGYRRRGRHQGGMASMYRSAHAFVLPLQGARVGACRAPRRWPAGRCSSPATSTATAFADSTNSLPVQCKVINAARACGARRGGAGVAASVDARPPRGGSGGARGERRRRHSRQKFGMSTVARLWAEEGEERPREVRRSAAGGWTRDGWKN